MGTGSEEEEMERGNDNEEMKICSEDEKMETGFGKEEMGKESEK